MIVIIHVRTRNKILLLLLSVLYTDERVQDRIEFYANKMPTGRILINSPASQGGIGDLYNFRLEPSLTLGCGSWGGNSVSENVGVKHLLNYKILY